MVHFRLVVACVLNLFILQAGDIEGSVIVKRRLSKPKVTAEASSYSRGAAVNLHSDEMEDPLAFERARVVVYLEGELPSEPVNAKMEQKFRKFSPDTLVIPAGSSVSFPNLDPIFHNVFSLSKPKTFDLGNYSREHSRTVTFSKPGIVFVNCHLHPNMGAAIVISPNRWSAKADAAGRFVLPAVPSGSYTIVAWHRSAGFFRQKIRVAGDRTSAVQFLIPVDEDRVRDTIARR
jgi:plastocyanin